MSSDGMFFPTNFYTAITPMQDGSLSIRVSSGEHDIHGIVSFETEDFGSAAGDMERRVTEKISSMISACVHSLMLHVIGVSESTADRN
jgi:hypothetical protein